MELSFWSCVLLKNYGSTGLANNLLANPINDKIPEEQAEDRKGTNASSTPGHSSENSTQESTDDENCSLPKLEVLNRVKRSPFILA